MSSSPKEASDTSNSSVRKRVVHIDPLEITQSLGFQTFRKGARKPWTKEEDSRLSSLVETEYPKPIDVEKVNWDYIAETLFPDGFRKGKECRKRWCNSLNPSLRRGKWSKEEDEKLVRAFEKYGASWLKVSQEIEGRTDDQCAKRYMEVLDPNTKNRLKPWSMEEDLRLIQQIKIHGTKWRTISNGFEGRPSLTCRNRWRKLVTDVVRGKADPLIKSQVENVTQKSIDDESNKDNILEVLSKKQQELTESNKENGPKSGKRFKRVKRDPDLPLNSPRSASASTPTSEQSRVEVEWRYALTPDSSKQTRNAEDGYFSRSNVFGEENGGVIKNQQMVQQLVSYAKKRHLNITVHQHIHHHYGSSAQQDTNNRTQPNRFNIEPEDQQARFQHFNYLPPLVEVPKLNSSQSSPNNSSYEGASGTTPTTTQFHHHHHHHHHHHNNHEKDQRIKPTRNNESAVRSTTPAELDGTRESDLIKLLNNTDELNKRETTPISNPLTPLAQAVEYVEAEENQKVKRRKLGASIESSTDMVNRAQHPNNDKNHDIPSEDEELDFWETMRNLTELPNSTLNNATGKPTVSNNKNNISHDTAYHNNATSSTNSKILTSTQFSQKPVSQHHPLHYYNSNTRENTPKPVLSQSQVRKQTENGQHNNDEEQEEGLDEEDKLLAREVSEVGVDQETLNSYGLFYNVYTREGSTFPEVQPQQSSQQQQQQQQQQQKYSVYDQWGGGFGIIPFNPS
ncbi:Myb-like DNA-binding protein, putative [Candida dubliniensis CD36]|uniref:Myb-like DNA-binding protein, putative n=1 Tax=Candida dubliniensis (strain CD36 / ATCC MYA-646 / CBS 7987 / NCPF 3949 / NRRL Y-17841) TaxID=573826 RepID=B9WGD6_CANDC|nr:Myb-like DNA-binding protein, putative [Candida dubliniensis CD36]CAX42310.1 Myb-like DNA-binding protein, putative [Candida dubliniensis CD36]